MIDPSKIISSISSNNILKQYEAWLKDGTVKHSNSVNSYDPPFKDLDESSISKERYFSYFFNFLSYRRYKNWKEIIKNDNKESNFYDFLFCNFDVLPIGNMINSIIGTDVKIGIWKHFEDLHKYPKSLIKVLEYIELPQEFLKIYDELQPALFTADTDEKIDFLSSLIKNQNVPRFLLERHFSKIRNNRKLMNAMISSKWRSSYESNAPHMIKEILLHRS